MQRFGAWNSKNVELYEATVNRTNNTCTLNKYRTNYLQALAKQRMTHNERVEEIVGEFIKMYCVKRPAQQIRWIRSIFYDDTDQIEKTLDFIRYAITTYRTHLIEEQVKVYDKIKESPAYVNLMTQWGQLDEDGICIAVSRQALEETMEAFDEAITTLRGEISKEGNK